MNLKFLLKRMSSINYSNMFAVVNSVSRRTGRSRIAVTRDLLDCVNKYGAGFVDYESFEMYDMTPAERAKVLTIGKNNELVKKLNHPDYVKYFDDKSLFYDKFDAFLKRKWMVLDGDNFDGFAEFCRGRESVIVKPLDLCCGKGIEKIYPAQENDLRAVYDRLLAARCVLAEEVAVQCDEMARLCRTSVNTIRLVTVLNGENAAVVGGAVRMGRDGNYVDNFNHGGLAVIIDAASGRSVTDGFDKQRNMYETVPVLGTKLKGFQVPQWDEVLALVREAALVIPQVRYVAWDVCVSRDHGPLLIEGNNFPGQDVTQYPKLGLGTYEVVTAALGE